MKKLKRDLNVDAESFVNLMSDLQQSNIKNRNINNNKKSQEKQVTKQSKSYKSYEEKKEQKYAKNYRNISLGIFFFLLFTLGGIIQLWNILENYFSSPILSVKIEDQTQIKEIMFSGNPWFILCSDHPMANQYLNQINDLKSSISKYAKIATLPCNETLNSGKTFIKRFDLYPSTLAFAVANDIKLLRFSYDDFINTTKLIKQINKHSKPKLNYLDNTNYITKQCINAKGSCILFGYKTSSKIKEDILSECLINARKSKLFLIDTTKYQMKFDEDTKAVIKTKQQNNNKENNDIRIFCLANSHKANETQKGNYYGLYHEGDTNNKASLKEFFKICSDAANQLNYEKLISLPSPPSFIFKANIKSSFLKDDIKYTKYDTIDLETISNFVDIIDEEEINIT